MRTTTAAAAAVLATTAVLGVATPALAARDGIAEYGHGTWTGTSPETTLTGASTGAPFDGDVAVTFTTDSGAPPVWAGCVPGHGTATVTSATRTLSLRLWGDVCGYVSPTVGHLQLRGWYEVTGDTGAKGRKAPAGVGAAIVETFSDGTGQWDFHGAYR